jgi:hypothetical protein
MNFEQVLDIVNNAYEIKKNAEKCEIFSRKGFLILWLYKTTPTSKFNGNSVKYKLTKDEEETIMLSVDLQLQKLNNQKVVVPGFIQNKR